MSAESIRLRGGRTTSDPRLDRIPQPDRRNLRFPIAEVLPSVTLRSRTWPCAPHLDQGQDGACVGFGWAHELAAQPVVIPVDDTLARSLYHIAQTLDEWPGEAYEGTSVLAGAKACQQQGFVSEYRWAFGIDDVLATLSNYGTVVLGTEWREGMFEPGPSGLLDVSGRVAGGHCYLARGNVLKQRLVGVGVRHVVRIRNSWGPGWGVGGDAYMTPEDLDHLLEAGGEACVPVDIRRVAV